MMNGIAVALAWVLVALSPAIGAAPLVVSDRAVFFANADPPLIVEDWQSYPPGTLLENQTFRGITYRSSSLESLVVGSFHGAGWLLGYAREDNRYASFSSETISFEFSTPITSFGVALSQGNQSQGVRYSGATTWLVHFDNDLQFFPSAELDISHFSGEAYFGALNLQGVTRVDITRLTSDAPIVWNIREVAFSVAQIPEPSSLILVLTGFLGFLGRFDASARR